MSIFAEINGIIMRFKTFFVYIAIGAAFLGASLWVLLSGGKNAKAVRTKYKLGGALLTTWAMLSAGTCNGPIPTVTCYDPVPPEQPMCYDVAVKLNAVSLESTVVKKGENFKITIEEPYADSFVARILDAGNKDLQKATLQNEEGSNWNFFFKASSSLPAGNAVLVVEALHKSGENEEIQTEEIFRTEVAVE